MSTRSLQRAAAAQHRPDPGQQFERLERPGDVVVRSAFLAADLVRKPVPDGKDDDRHIPRAKLR